MKKEIKKGDLKRSIKLLKSFQTLNFKQQNELIQKLEKKLKKDV